MKKIEFNELELIQGGRIDEEERAALFLVPILPLVILLRIFYTSIFLYIGVFFTELKLNLVSSLKLRYWLILFMF
jgi:hypothetical protein